MKSISKLKKELDKWFSLYIRLRYAYEDGITECFTCYKIDHYKKLQCGHFMSRRHQSTRWHEENCQVQCVKCNMFEQGMQWKFGENLDNKYGKNTSENLYILSRKSIKMFRFDYEEKISYYKNAVNNLKKEKGID